MPEGLGPFMSPLEHRQMADFDDQPKVSEEYEINPETYAVDAGIFARNKQASEAELTEEQLRIEQSINERSRALER